MNYLQEKILREGTVNPGNILKIDNFLNHQVDIATMRQMAWDIVNRFEGTPVTKVLTIEASGIPFATMVSNLMNVPMVYARKSLSATGKDPKYVSRAYSFTHKREETIYVSRPFISADDRLLLLDDFLAEGEAMNALIDIVQQAGASVAGIGVVVEKGNQKGARILTERGFRVEALAVVERMDYETQELVFREEQIHTDDAAMVTERDKAFMREAIRIANESVLRGGGPFGAVIVNDGKIIAGCANSVTTDNDPTAHAEVNAIREACRVLGTHDLSGCTIYSSCEPCPMSLGAICWARIDRIYYGNTRKDASAVNFADDRIYREVQRPLYARTLPTIQLLREEAQSSFRLWKEKTDKTEY